MIQNVATQACPIFKYTIVYTNIYSLSNTSEITIFDFDLDITNENKKSLIKRQGDR